MFTFSLCKYCHHPILCDYKEVEIIGAGSYGFKLSVSSFMGIYGYLSLILFEINKSSFLGCEIFCKHSGFKYKDDGDLSKKSGRKGYASG